MKTQKYKKKSFFKIHKFGCDVFTAIMVIVCGISIAALDSPSFIPFITMVLSGGWVVFYAYKTGYFYGLGGDDR